MRVFVYGTLTEPEAVREVLDSFVFVGPATLHGLHAVDGRYPTLAPGGEVAGRLLRTDETDALDAYERVDDELYVRVAVPLRESSDAVSDEANAANAADATNVDSSTNAEDAANETDVTAETADGDDETIAVYVGDPDRLDAPVDWPGDGPFVDRVRKHVRTNPVHVSRR